MKKTNREMTPMKWFMPFLWVYRWRMFFGLVLVTILVAAALVSPKISGMIVDDVIQGGRQDMLMKLIGLLVLAIIVRGVCRIASQVLFETSSQGVLYNMRAEVYRKLLYEDFTFYNKNRTGDLMGRQTGDMDAIRHFVAYVIYIVYENILYFVVALVMIFTIHVKVAAAMVCVLPFTAAATYLQFKQVHPAFKNCRSAFSRLNTLVQENISGNRVVKAFAKEDYEMEKFAVENDNYREAELGATRIWRRFVPVFEVLSQLLNVVLMIFGGIMVIRGEMTLGGLVEINGYLWMLTMPLRMAGWWINDIQRFTTSVEKIYDTYSAEPQVANPVQPVDHSRVEGGVEFRHVSYKVDGEQVLKDVSFRVEPGQTVGILGTTGSGKTTLMNLLCRFYDVTEGEVLVDGTDVRQWNLQQLRSGIGVAMQDVFLFSDTIAGNISYGAPDKTMEDIRRVAVMADADGFIRNMPQGYETVVGERGVGLSGGQKQRISLARALIKDPSILILDDTTSAVDMETEAYIQEELNKIAHRYTTFVIAYRISSLRHADQILVVDEGRIIEHGTHEELCQAGGYYASVYAHQYMTGEEE